MDDYDNDGGYLPPSMMNDVRNAIAKNMAENGPDEKPGAVSNLPTVNIEDIFSKNKDLLNEETREAMAVKVDSTIKINDDKTISQVRYLGKRATKDRVDEAVSVVVEKLNELGSAGLIEGSLLPLSMLQFASVASDDPEKEGEVAVISYVMLTPKGVRVFDEDYLDVKLEEGGQVSSI